MHRLAEAVPNTTKSKQKFRELKFQSIDANLNHLSDDNFPVSAMPLFKVIDKIQTACRDID